MGEETTKRNMDSDSSKLQDNIEALIKRLQGPLLNEEGLPFVDIIEHVDSDVEVEHNDDSAISIRNYNLKPEKALSKSEEKTSAKTLKSKEIPIVSSIKEKYISTDSAFLEYLQRIKDEEEDEMGVDDYPEWIQNSIFGEYDSHESESENELVAETEKHRNVEVSSTKAIKKVRFAEKDEVLVFNSQKSRQELGLSKFKAKRMGIFDDDEE
eukprot:NODE_356_length_10223_cov_0.363098.p4 type:complete len:211 gc:universal NODE_356_length_10223_cov_0.363098:6305-6937(+)